MSLTKKQKEINEKVEQLIKVVLQHDIDEDKVNEEELEFALITLFTILNNILFQTGDIKRRKFQLKNPKIKKLVDSHGAFDLLKYAGFKKKGEFLELPLMDIKVGELQTLVDQLYLQIKDEDKVKLVKYSPEEEKNIKPSEEQIQRELEKKKKEEEEKKLEEEKKKEEEKKREEERKKYLLEREEEEKRREEQRKEEEKIRQIEEEKRKEKEKFELEKLLNNEKLHKPILLSPKEQRFIKDLNSKLDCIIYDNEENQNVISYLKTLRTIISNVNQVEEKFRTLKTSSKKLSDLFKAKGTIQLLKFIGFQTQNDSLFIKLGTLSDGLRDLALIELDSLIDNPKVWIDKKPEIVKQRKEEERKKEEEEKRKQEQKQREEEEQKRQEELKNRKIENKPIERKEPEKKVESKKEPEKTVGTKKEPEKKVETKKEPEKKVETKKEPEKKVETKKEPEKKVEPKKEPEKKVETKKEPEQKKSSILGWIFGSNNGNAKGDVEDFNNKFKK